MKHVEIDEATASLGDYARALADEPLVPTSGGRPVAALVPIDEADLDAEALGSDPRFLALIERARAEHRAGGSRPADEVWRELLGS
jgi:antitoxin (DNA-binding transcriptional repressor) of toxin-antitoxin stability system